MSLYAIGDLHLSGGQNKPMDIFGPDWVNHKNKIETNWRRNIGHNDTVLIPGDISWAMKTEEVYEDLDFIAQLPGRKLLIKGNHDYWWNSTGKLNGRYSNMEFLQNDSSIYEDYAVCGSRGWDLPSDKFTDADHKTFKRELGRMKLSLESGLRSGREKILYMMHFPPYLENMGESAFIELLKQYPVEIVVYGHIHGRENFRWGIQGHREVMEFHLVSADYIGFNPVLIKQ